MTTIIGLALALYFGPTQEQIQYCMEESYAYEVIEINGKYIIPEETKAKEKLCERILEMPEVEEELRYY